MVEPPFDGIFWGNLLHTSGQVRFEFITFAPHRFDFGEGGKVVEYICRASAASLTAKVFVSAVHKLD